MGIEEEFGILDPETHTLPQRFEELRDRAVSEDRVLAESIAGELISSEIEIRSGRGANLADALAHQRDPAAPGCSVAPPSTACSLGATGAHPWAPWQEQRIIDTEHYRRVEEGLKYVAWRNNTFSVHVHVGIRGADRAVAICDRMRRCCPCCWRCRPTRPSRGARLRPPLGPHRALHASFPRCGIPEPFGDFDAYADYVDFLFRTNSIVEHTQLWWSVRPHHAFGTVEVRICDAQSTAEESSALVSLIVACVAQAALEYDEGTLPEAPAGRLIEENFWRAIRHGLDGRMIDLERGEEYAAAALGDRLLAWTAPARAALGIDVALPPENGAQRQRRSLEAGATLEGAFMAEVAATQRSYAGEGVVT